jgi:hypothetical protein
MSLRKSTRKLQLNSSVKRSWDSKRALMRPLLLGGTMEETEISVDFLMTCALHPGTWFAWVPETIIDKVPLNTKVSISCTPDGVWIIADKEHNLLFSTEPTTIIKTDESVKGVNVLKLLFAALAKDTANEPPDDPPPQKVA